MGEFNMHTDARVVYTTRALPTQQIRHNSLINIPTHIPLFPRTILGISSVLNVCTVLTSPSSSRNPHTIVGVPTRNDCAQNLISFRLMVSQTNT